MKIHKIIISLFLVVICYGQQNRLFWDGHDWNRIAKNVDYHPANTHRIKTAYLHGALDGRLHGYLKTWAKDQYLADDVFAETVDYLTTRELIKNLDYFYQDPINSYIPIPAAIVIANMYAERIPVPMIDDFIEITRRWINDLTLELDTLNYNKLIEDKFIKHHEKKFNRSE
ncbi:MAG: hypothetical protein HN674_08650 [Candidatus Marinimicrobia bacterium]|jgi:hypothetical protein|nr:hypothetical protein [Candidatus Neomarinimicrobiota bacterium]MBT3501541.1 hypothetical protein [Candidatus Neomarinimicrobiota bacterium]MBT3839673.1 hypothetical protein [Candidatus Neomarinimicrobiota bacterium]MBT4282678.1 hypothetical protein [Candidatus Neomarinimicrobiota bacterium]MBT4580042.1 hypothetical protein [Candidatus Neomarinimicrobiota bacterium]